MAMQSPPEKTAFVAMLDPTRTTPDALAVVDVDPASKTYSQTVGRVDMPNRRRRTASFWLECVQFLPMPVLAASAHGAAIPCRAGYAVSRIHIIDTKPDPRHPKIVKVIEPETMHEPHRLQPPAHGALRTGRHLPQRAGLAGGRRPRRHLHDGPGDVRQSGAAGSWIVARSIWPTTSGGTWAATP